MDSFNPYFNNLLHFDCHWHEFYQITLTFFGTLTFKKYKKWNKATEITAYEVLIKMSNVL